MSVYSDNGFARAQWAYEHRSPPEPVECCELRENDPDHDTEQCLADQREAAAEDKAERMRDDWPDDDWMDA